MDHIATLGPCAIDTVPVTKFSRPPLDQAQFEDLWRLCGPSAERNLAHNPLWVVIVMAYYEGLEHATNFDKEWKRRGLHQS